MNLKQVVVLFYKYILIDDPEGLMKAQKELCGRLGLRGRMIIASEGINANFEGTPRKIQEYVRVLKSDARFGDVDLKFSSGDGKSFPKLSIRVRDEIVAAHLGELDVNPIEVTGKYITADQLHAWFETKKEFYIVDMRNDFEQEVGMFEGSVKSGMHLFRDLPETLEKIKNLKGKTIVTVCTGGVRCEKASGFLVKNGFSDVYQLLGGIHTYMEKYPNEHFVGALYVFDQRVVMGFNMESSKRKVVGKCASCGVKCENFVNCRDSDCNRHFIACSECSKEKILCPMGCYVSKDEKRGKTVEARSGKQ